MSARSTIRVAVLGAASFAEVAHIPGINGHPDAEVVALYSRNLSRARQMATRCGVAAASDDLDALLARDDIVAVSIASSNDQHYPYAMAALRAGKHVFCEKPMALTESDAAAMTREAAQRGSRPPDRLHLSLHLLSPRVAPPRAGGRDRYAVLHLHARRAHHRRGRRHPRCYLARRLRDAGRGAGG